MKKRFAIASALVAALALTGCAPQSDLQKAHEGCVQDAISQLPEGVSEVNTSKMETANMSEAMRELIENPLPPDPEDGVMYSTTGDIWYRDSGDDESRSVLCLTTMKDGQPEEPFEATLTIVD